MNLNYQIIKVHTDLTELAHKYMFTYLHNRRENIQAGRMKYYLFDLCGHACK